MAISFSRPDPSSPAAVGSAQFSVGRRGYEQDEVRDFLRMVSAELARLQERERFLESELRAMQTQGLSSPGVLDEETVMRVLGEETARVLTAAREAAQQLRTRAAESAERIVREASADAARLRQDAEIEVARQCQDALADAEAEIELAKQQGREMVAEARAYREKVLSELSRRRELAREQIEHLIHHRDRLATAFERARLAATDVVGNLDEFDELAEEIEKGAGLIAGVGTPVFVDHTKDPDAIPQRQTFEKKLEQMSEIITDEDETSLELTSQDSGHDVEENVDENSPAPVDSPDQIELKENKQDAIRAEHPSTEHPATQMADVVPLFGPKKTEHSSGDISVVTDKVGAAQEDPQVNDAVRTTKAKDRKSVDELFAKLRESKVENVIRPHSPMVIEENVRDTDVDLKAKSDAGVVPYVDQSQFQLRDKTLSPAAMTIGRIVKRFLADQENTALTLLQSKKFTLSIDTLLPTIDAMVDELALAISSELTNVAISGAQSVTPGLKADLRKKVTKPQVLSVVAPLLRESIVAPLHSQIESSIDQCNRDKVEMTNLTRSAFRELKIRRVDAFVMDISCLAYSRGAYLVLEPGTKVCWMVDPSGPSCADAEDNSLAGLCSLGDQFPTGHLHPICHAGCRCLLGIKK